MRASLCLLAITCAYLYALGCGEDASTGSVTGEVCCDCYQDGDRCPIAAEALECEEMMPWCGGEAASGGGAWRCVDGVWGAYPSAAGAPAPDSAECVAVNGEGWTCDSNGDCVEAPPAPPTGQFTAVEPGGDTICARGTPFRFFVYGGDPTRVVIDFLGGGACWNAFTCAIGRRIQGQPIFQDSAGSLGDLESDLEAGLLGGIYDVDNPENPYYGWTLVRVPYCSGDFYWGNKKVDYAEDVTIHHFGFKNAQSVTAWVTTHYPAAVQVVTTGCEAGAYGALNQALTLADFYPEAIVTSLGDSGAGIITDTFFADAFPTWDAFESMPLHLEGLAGKDLENITVTDFVVAAAASNPALRVAQYTTAYDTVQSYHYLFMGGDVNEWHDLALESLTHIRAQADNFRYYVAPGPIHCINPYDITYMREVNGVAYQDWLRDLIGNEVLPNHVMCEGDCRDDPICAGCADGSLESMACTWCDDWVP